MRDFRVNDRFTLTNSEGEPFEIQVVSLAEVNQQPHVNIRPDGGELMTIPAAELDRVLNEQGIPAAPRPKEEQDSLTPAEALALYEQKKGNLPTPAPTPAAEPVADRSTARARALDEEPAAPRVPLTEDVLTVGQLIFHLNPARAIGAWHEAQNRAIGARGLADERKNAAMLAACEGMVKGMKLSNEQARKAYAENESAGSEGNALRAEAEAKAYYSWVGYLTRGAQ